MPTGPAYRPGENRNRQVASLLLTACDDGYLWVAVACDGHPDSWSDMYDDSISGVPVAGDARRMVQYRVLQ